MSDYFIWFLAGAVILSYPGYRMGLYLWERFFLTSEERWKRKYDRRMKKFFSAI